MSHPAAARPARCETWKYTDVSAIKRRVPCHPAQAGEDDLTAENLPEGAALEKLPAQTPVPEWRPDPEDCMAAFWDEVWRLGAWKLTLPAQARTSDNAPVILNRGANARLIVQAGPHADVTVIEKDTQARGPVSALEGLDNDSYSSSPRRRGSSEILPPKDSRIRGNDGSFVEGPAEGQYGCSVTHIDLEEGASLRHLRGGAYGESHTQVETLHARVDAGALYDLVLAQSGGETVRSTVYLDLDGPGAHASICGAAALNGKAHRDAYVRVRHSAPECTSNQTMKWVLGGMAKGVFRGKVIVDPGAQKTDAYQLSNAVLLSETAEMNNCPELEIYADDVKCSHGATTGQIDEDCLFYMRARGIPRDTALRLYLESFLSEGLGWAAAEQTARDLVLPDLLC